VSTPRWSRTAALLVAVAVAVAVLGAPLGWLWAVLAPKVRVQVVPGGVVPAEEQPEEFFAADGWFILLGAAFGVLAAVVVWFALRRHRGPAALVALTVGAVGAGVLAWWIGHRIGLSAYRHRVRDAAAGTELDRPPQLRAKELGWWFGFIPRVKGDLLMPAIAAAVGYTMLAAWSRYPSLGGGDAAEPRPPGPDQGPPGPDQGPAGLDQATAPPGQSAAGPGQSAAGPGQSAAGPGQATAPPGGRDQLELGGTASSDSGTGTART